jgi:hypothetical protein
VGEFGLLRLFGRDFSLDGVPIGPGSYSDVAGLLSGTLESGQSLNVSVSVAATAALQIVPEPASGMLLGLALALPVGRRAGPG